MTRWRTELAAAFALLSRLPVGRFLPDGVPVDFAWVVWAYPVVGAVLGILGGAVFWVAVRLGMMPVLAAGWALVALLLLGGALHEDGLADTADGFGGGRDAARKLEIMRDSRIGSYGALALVMSLGLRWAALVGLGSAAHVAIGLVVAGALGRAAIIIVLLAARPARRDGLAAGLAAVPAGAAACGLAVAGGLAVLLLPVGVAVVAGLAAAVVGVGLARFGTRQIGGHSGDLLGATSVVTECVVLSVLVAAR
ncbi:MAG TPA: adenosylcobinamide-GDP ribazoletransferase [Acetobacteraceae bacterium]|jgi:adenosylcobinamide-GDP ribazoletransferase